MLALLALNFAGYNMGERRKAREFALQAMYAIDQSKLSPAQALACFWAGNNDLPDDLRSFTERLVLGACERSQEIDQIITTHSANWKIQRMSVVDRNLLRLAIFELKWCDEIPLRVSLNEAIEIAKQYGTEESGSFVNGILDKVAKGLNKE